MIKEIPYPFPIFGMTGLSTFSIFLVLAFLTASYLVPRELKRRGLDPEVADWTILLCVIGAIVGAKIGFVFEVWGEIWVVDKGFGETLYNVLFNWNGMADKLGPARAVGLWASLFSRGGLVFYGGFILSFILITTYLRRKKLNVWVYADAFIPSAAIGYAVGRLGCLVSGDGCFGYGASLDIPILTMVYGPNSFQSSAGVNVWNTPIMEAILSTAIFAVMMLWLRYKTFRPGMLTALFLVYNGTARFFVEFLRVNDAVFAVRPPPMIDIGPEKALLTLQNADRAGKGAGYFYENWHWYGFTQGQLTGVVLIAAGLAWILWKKLYKLDGPAQPDPAAAPKKQKQGKKAKKAA